MLQKIRWFLLLFGIMVVVTIAFQNSGSVDVDLLIFQGAYPLTLLLLGCSAASFVLGALMTGWMFRGRNRSAAAKKQPKASAETAKASPKI